MLLKEQIEVLTVTERMRYASNYSDKFTVEELRVEANKRLGH